MPNDKAAVKKHFKALGPLANDDSFADALGDLADAEAAGTPELDQAIADPAGYFKKRGIKLPPNTTVEITKNSPLRISVCVNSFCIGWTF